MSDRQSRILVTGASGQLGRLVVERLSQTLPAPRIVAMVRDAAKGADLAGRGVEIREGDYADPATLDKALAGIDRVLLVSSNQVGQRAVQHGNVIEAARKAGVSLLAYTSILRADTTPMKLAAEHLETETALRQSGVPFALLRNGWYNENYLNSLPFALQHGAIIGSAGDGRISSAARADYADAAATVLASDEPQAGKIYELAGDESYTLAQLAAEIARQSGKPVVFTNLPEAEYKAALLGAGLPEPLAALLADSDVQAANGALFDDGHDLSRLTGKATTPFAASVAAALKTLGA